MDTLGSPVRAVDHALHRHANGHAEQASASAEPMTNSEETAVGGLLRHDAAKGAAVHEFDPDATPEQKAAAAGSAKAQLAAIPGIDRLRHVKKEAGRAINIDTSSATTSPPPTVTIADVDKASTAEGQAVGADSIPGSIPAGAAPPVPTWMQTGWRQVAGIDAMGPNDAEHQRQTGIMADYISETMYGAWFHNAAIIIFTVLATRFITVLHLGWGWILLLLAGCASYYQLSVSRTRSRARDDIQRELVKTRLVTETESADWLNQFLDRFWLIYEPVLSQTIVASVDSVLATSTPSFLESIRMTTFTLGTKAPNIDYVRTFPKTPEDIVIMDWALSFTPNDLEDLTPRQAAKRVNPKVVLTIRVGKGAVSKSLPILLEDVSFSGKMRIKLKLMTNFPHVQTIDLSFIEKPTFDYVLKPLGGDTFGFDINNIPGLAPFIREQVHANLGPMMYDPNVFTIDLQSLLSGTPLDSAVGVLKVSILNARGLKAVKLGGGAPDAYVSVALGVKPAVSKTKTVTSSSNPSWHDTQFILVNTLADMLHLSLWDYNDHRPDNLLGTVSQELGGLIEDAEQEGLVGKIVHGGKDRGELRYDLSYFPVLQPTKNPDGTVDAPPDTETGIVRLTIHQAKDLDTARGRGSVSPFAAVYLGGSIEPVHRTTTMKHQNQPIWESACEFLVAEKHSSVITVKITDVRDHAVDPTLGSVTVRLVDLLEARARQQDWFPLKGSRAGKVRFDVEWKPVAMTGSIAGAAVYVPPIGILRLWLKQAVDVKNVEATLGGKSDPYVRVLGNNKILARTEIMNNNLNPEWDSIVYVPVHNLRENIILEVMDFQNMSKDRSLGHVELNVADFAQATSDQKYPYASRGSQVRAERIKLDKANAYKGTLMYEADFRPATSLRGGVSFGAQKNEIKIEAEHRANEEIGVLTPSSAKGSLSNLPSPFPPTPGGMADVTESYRHPSPATHRPQPSIGGESSRSAVVHESRAGGEQTASENPEVGVNMTSEELLASQSGVLVIQVISGQLARRGSLEIMFDDGYWPSFTSNRARSNHPTWDQVGEGFVRELDFSRIWFRINAADEGDKADIVAEFRSDTKDFLEQCLSQPADFLLSQADGSNRSMIKMSARYVPVDISLEPRESINNMGVLRVDVLSAEGLHPADRSGKSDPFVVFTLNGAKVFKSETKKKTLSPVWNEVFEVMIPSRVAARFGFEISDWDRVGTSTLLGSNSIDLASLEPFQASELQLPVTHESHAEVGILSVRLLFQPEIIVRTRQKTSTFSTAGRAITQIGAVPVGVGKGVVHGGVAVAGGVGHGIGAVGGFAGRHIHLTRKKDHSGKEYLVSADQADNSAPDGNTLNGYGEPNGHSSAQQPSPITEGRSLLGNLPGPSTTTLPAVQSGEGFGPGTLTITVLSGKDLGGSAGVGSKPFVALKVGNKTQKTEHKKGVEVEWNESFSFGVAPGTLRFTAIVFDHHHFGKHAEIGEVEVDIWRNLQPPTLTSTEVALELTGGTGLLRLRLDWAVSASPAPKMLGARGRTASVSSKTADSPSRFNLLKRGTHREEKE